MKKIISFLFLLSAFYSHSLLAWDGIIRGKIQQVHVTEAENYGFRVMFTSKATLCGNQHTWAYLNKSDSNYETYVSTLLSAKHAGTDVLLYTNQDGSSQNYCKIGYVILD
ncbi:hypothetical protein [Vibrio neptunius]|uniref:hypothetical protein n=1 Tax=Vibrio neptunius TaxID=170651 RepID=UPI000A527021|nr:hypothetical protein [Vibrio neptunius]